MPEPHLHQEDGVTVLDFGPGSHTLDEAAIVSLEGQLLEVSNVDPPLLVIDLSGVQFFGSSFIEILFRLWSRLKGRDGRFALCGLSEYCREVIDVTRLDHLWTICDSVDDAVATVKAE